MASDGSEGDSSDVNGASEEWDEGEADVDVEGDGHPDPPPRGLGMNVDVDIEMNASIEVDGRTRRVKRRKVRKKSNVEDPTHVNGEKDAIAAASGSTVKPKTKKAIDLGPLVGVKRGFRTRERAPMNGGWGGVEIVPSSLRAFPEVGVEEDPRVGGKGKGKAQVADGEWLLGDAHTSVPSSLSLPLYLLALSLLVACWVCGQVTNIFFNGLQRMRMSALHWLPCPHACARLGLDLQVANRNNPKNLHRKTTQHAPRVGEHMKDGEALMTRTLRVRYPFLVPWRVSVSVAKVVVASRARWA